MHTHTHSISLRYKVCPKIIADSVDKEATLFIITINIIIIVAALVFTFFKVSGPFRVAVEMCECVSAVCMCVCGVCWFLFLLKIHFIMLHPYKINFATFCLLECQRRRSTGTEMQRIIKLKWIKISNGRKCENNEKQERKKSKMLDGCSAARSRLSLMWFGFSCEHTIYTFTQVIPPNTLHCARTHTHTHRTSANCFCS